MLSKLPPWSVLLLGVLLALYVLPRVPVIRERLP